MHQPRGILARTLYEKYHNDEFINNYDFNLWYQLPNEGKEIDERYRSKFLNLAEPDDGTVRWLEESKTKSADLWLQLWHIFCKTFLKLFLTQTCCNGLLRRGSMFILSENVSCCVFEILGSCFDNNNFICDFSNFRDFSLKAVSILAMNLILACWTLELVSH